MRTAHLAVEERLLLSASAPWVACPAALLLPFKGRTFEIQARSLRHLLSTVRGVLCLKWGVRF